LKPVTTPFAPCKRGPLAHSSSSTGSAYRTKVVVNNLVNRAPETGTMKHLPAPEILAVTKS